MSEAQKRQVRVSKTMTKILRHSAKDDRVPIDEEGFVRFNDLLSHRSFSRIRPPVTEAEVRRVVSSCNKQRFSIREPDMVRANQGHSFELEALDLVVLSDDELLTDRLCVHGTNRRAWLAIREEGLSRMQRNHIHAATGLPGDSGVISGMRNNAPIHVYISTTLCLAAGIPFYLSANNVLLSPGNEQGLIPPSCFSLVRDGKTGETLFQRDLAEIAKVREEYVKKCTL